MPTVSFDGTTWHYLEQGTGEPTLVLLHAFPFHAGMWEPQFAGLSGEVRVVAPDLLGFGRSDAPDDPGAYSVDGWADGTAAVLDHLGLHRVVLGGLSMGGYAAFAFLRRHRHRLAGLILADTRAGPDTPEVAERRSAQQRQVLAGEMAEVIDTLVQGLLSNHTRRHRPEVVQAAKGCTDNPPAGVVGGLEAMRRRPDSTPDLVAIDVPTLIVVGEEDAASPPAVARAMQAAIPTAELAVLPGAGHLSNLEAPHAFNRAVLELLGRARTARPPR